MDMGFWLGASILGGESPIYTSILLLDY